MSKKEKIDFDELQNPFEEQELPELTDKHILEVVENPSTFYDMTAPERFRFLVGTFGKMAKSKQLRTQVIGMLKK